MHTTPYASPCPLQSFRQAGFDAKLLAEISSVGYETPTAMQAQALPVVMSGCDLIGLAKTGRLCAMCCSFLWQLFVFFCICIRELTLNAITFRFRQDASVPVADDRAHPGPAADEDWCVVVFFIILLVFEFVVN